MRYTVDMTEAFEMSDNAKPQTPNKKKFLIIGAILTLSLIGGTMYYAYGKQKHSETVHYHAGFLVYIDGVKQDYSDFAYMNFIPCSEHDNKKSPEEEQIEKAHLHDSVGDVVHVHRQGANWQDLFKNIKVTIPSDKSLTIYSNGSQVGDNLTQPIEPNQSIIIAIGNTTNIDTNLYVPLSHIQEVESKSELCGTN